MHGNHVQRHRTGQYDKCVSHSEINREIVLTFTMIRFWIEDLRSSFILQFHLSFFFLFSKQKHFNMTLPTLMNLFEEKNVICASKFVVFTSENKQEIMNDLDAHLDLTSKFLVFSHLLILNLKMTAIFEVHCNVKTTILLNDQNYLRKILVIIKSQYQYLLKKYGNFKVLKFQNGRD